MPLIRSLLALGLMAGTSHCGLSTGPSGFADPELDPQATVRILFVGNSLTYANDLPSMVKAFADSAGIAGVQVAQVAKPDYALEDHWNDGQAPRVIEAGGWHWVVLQQGPSAVLANRVNLREWTANFSTVIRSKGGQPALYQVWPQLVNFSDFDASAESYRLAAVDVNGLLLAAGNAWRAAWARNAATPLYSNDGLHPSIQGSYTAALTVFGGIFHRSVVGLPGGLTVPSGSFQLTAAQALLLQESVDEVNAPLIHP